MMDALEMGNKEEEILFSDWFTETIRVIGEVLCVMVVSIPLSNADTLLGTGSFSRGNRSSEAKVWSKGFCSAPESSRAASSLVVLPIRMVIGSIIRRGVLSILLPTSNPASALSFGRTGQTEIK